MFKTHFRFFILCVLLAVISFIRFNHGWIQQDNYLGYAASLGHGLKDISYFDSRLFPGFPIVIYFLGLFTGNFIVSGYLAVFLAFLGSYIILYKLTGSSLSFLPLIFPPILLSQSSLIATEIPFIFVILFGVYLMKNKRFSLAFLVFGVSVWFRLAGLGVIFGVFLYYILKRDFRKFLIYLPYFAIPITLLLVYDTHFFGAGNLFVQLFTQGQLRPGPKSIVIIQLAQDVLRAFRWHWYRIFVSGLFYIALYITLWFKSVKTRSLEFWIISGIYIFTLSANYAPFLEGLGRYLGPTIPLFWLILHDRFKSGKWLYLLLPVSVLVVLI